jgi:pyrimidine-nucleoside phosphorylase
VALLTAMDVPLGRAIGNGPETAEAIRALAGAEPRGGDVDDLMEVTLALAGEMVRLGGRADTPEAGRALAQDKLSDGSALATLRALVEAQGGDLAVLDHPDRLHGAPVATVEAPPEAGGFVTGLDALALGHAAVALGAGRARKEDAVDPRAGFVLNKKPGDPVEPGEPLAEIFASDASRVHAEAVRAAFAFGPEPPARPPVLLDRYDGARWTGF